MIEILRDFKEKLIEDGKVEQKTLKFQNLSSDEKRMIYTMGLCSKFNICLPKCRSQKSASLSKLLRENGNKVYVRSNTPKLYSNALELYSKSIAFAPNESKELSLAYGNRSAVLYRLGKYDECVQEIERCLRLNYPDHLRFKILLRKTECLGLLKSPRVEKAYEETLAWIQSLNNEETRDLKAKLDACYKKKDREETKQTPVYLDPIFENFSYVNSNSEVPACSDALAVKYNDDFGRHVVAARDIRAGEILAKETPYSMISNSYMRYFHCWKCLAFAWNVIPCEHCEHVIYCSEKCRKEAWKEFHDVECPVLRHLLNLEKNTENINYFKFHISSLRIVILGVRELGSIANLVDEIADIEKCSDMRVKGFSKDGKFYSNKYRSVHCLITNVENRSVVDLFDRSMFSSIIVYFLATQTEFFGSKLSENWKELRSNKRVTFIGGLILRHLQIVPSNAHSYGCGFKIKDEDYHFEEYEIGGVVMPFFSFLNHSCNANVSRICKNHYLMLFAIYPIKKGEQIFDDYGYHYLHMPKKSRQMQLLTKYFFKCNCIVCQEDWPVHNRVKSYVENIKCKEMKTSLDLEISSCNLIYSDVTREKIEHHNDILTLLSDKLEFIMNHVTLPCEEVIEISEHIKKIFMLTETFYTLPNIDNKLI